MTTNLFEEVKNRKQQMKKFTDAALEKGWIDKNTYDGIIEKINNDTLTIGVIGQMKCGKSTFLNAFLFEDDILPAATTPMTAALSVITYGETERIEAEFYSKTEWDEMQMIASYDLNEKDKAFESKIKTAKELVEKASCLGSSLHALLGTKKTDNFENLIEYVGADGYYVAITKSVTIYYPKEWLKNVEIVDTPGFNDPVVSREERTREFLKKADVVLMLLYAGRAFDETDRDILFEKVRNAGIGKVLIGINKYDLNYLDENKPETPEEIINNVKSGIQNACEKYRDPMINELLEELKPIPFSANMALMAKMPLEKVKDPDLFFQWERICNGFEISTQKEMFKKSLIGDLESAIQGVIEKSKVEILLKKPVNMILLAGIDKKAKVEKLFNDKKILFESLRMPDDELHERIEGLSKAQKCIEKEIDRAIDDLERGYNKKIKSIIKSLEDMVDAYRGDIYRSIEREKKSKRDNEVKYRFEMLTSRILPRKIKKSEEELHKLLEETSEELESKVKEIIKKYVPKSNEIWENFSSVIRKGVIHFENEQMGKESTYLTALISAINKYPSYKDDCRKKVDEIFRQLNFNDICKDFLDKKPEYMNFLHTAAVSEILESLISQLKEVLNDKSNREEKLRKAEEDMNILSKEKERVANEIAEMQRMKMAIM